MPPLVWRLGWISYFADVASEMAYPVLPLFLKGLGAPAAAIGFIEGLANATASVLKGFAGIRSDKTGNRARYIQWGYGFSAAGKPLIALAFAWPLVTLARVLDRYGKGIRTTARDALLADAAPKDRLGAVFGLHRALDTAGAFTGVLITLALIQFIPGNYRAIFLIAGIPGFLAVALALGIKDAKDHVAAPVPTGPWAAPAAYKKVVALHALFALANTSDAFLLLRAKDAGFSESGVIGAYLVYNVVYAALSFPAGKLSDKIGRWPVTAAGWATYAAVYMGFAFMGAGWVWPLFLLYGVYIAVTDGVAKAQVSELVPKDRKGTGLGIFYMISGLCAFLGNLVFGLVWDRFGSATALSAAAGAAGLAVLAIPFVRQNPKQV